MGLYTQSTYAKYGPHWNENLFYCHLLSLPLFLPILPSLWRQLTRLWASPLIDFAIEFQSPIPIPNIFPFTVLEAWIKPATRLSFSLPKHFVNLLLNSLTQYACIRGVNLLGARTSALGVTIVLNVRKLISLFISIWLFGNELPVGVLVGAAVVFAGGGVYAWEGTRMKERKVKSL